MSMPVDFSVELFEDAPASAIEKSASGYDMVVEFGQATLANQEAIAQPGLIEVYLGMPGPKGDPGSSVSYVHTQATPAATWTIAHGLGRTPHSVTVWMAGELVEADVVANATNAVITFPSPTAGEAHIL